MKPVAREEPGEIRVFKPHPRVLLTTFIGRVGRTQSLAVIDSYFELIADMDRPIWVSDATQLTWFEPGSLTLGSRWFSAFRARGGKHCLVASNWEAAMMAARAMALGVGVRVAHYPDVKQATAAAHALLEQAA